MRSDIAIWAGTNAIGVVGGWGLLGLCVTRDSSKEVLLSWAFRVLGIFTLLIGELVALREGLRLTMRFGFSTFEVELDALQASK